jgi:hypothetical protein
MIGKCEYCGEKLPDDVRVDMKFCSDDHRVKFHNAKRGVMAAYNKAMKAIAQLESMSDETNMIGRDAKMCLRQIKVQLTEEK